MSNSYPIPDDRSASAPGSATRNKVPIANALYPLLSSLPPASKILEIASGTGEHIEYLASLYPTLQFFPTEARIDMLDSLRRISERQPNVQRPHELHVFDSTHWANIEEEGPFDVVLAFNLIHIGHPTLTPLLLSHSARLAPGLVLYGAFKIDGRFMSEGDKKFDESLKSRDPEWGLREMREIEGEARRVGFGAWEVAEMPAGNWVVVVTKGRGGGD
ncbi:DUF938-domain-containing protein [Saitoella complicata NRRL Y-17804]|uniref:Methyltransferase domain-containing protein n=1 Tax=Saitoella complicata (strain BCRC 22490 / CBS 7301 / JCM 7358 / NBRC 10748 / NRRL Y-17804) TaxID=698492 RepID=A0A0E9NKN1_SAICN|nr:DUF938-domain-containing protein [Saitoella complicata NRRL Y-17804]ODQ50489.1 DUF938-domain-containing protein [Saitoella complicata NRRL Y-17804]GAO50266.1 hypothetical protein G7K_4398-t1 [Saitoella complicata NRRL Y-17804]